MAKARRRWYRPRNVVIGVVLLLAGVLGVQVYRALTAEPGQAIDYGRLTLELTERHQPAGTGPEDPNAWVILRDAAEVAQGFEQEMVAKVGARETPYDYTVLFSPSMVDTYKDQFPAMVERSRVVLEQVRAAGVFERLDEAARAPRAVRPGPQPGPIFNWLLPELGRFRNFARMNAARMHDATRAGDGEELVRAYETSLAMGRACRGQTFLIDGLVGVAVESLASAQLAHSMVERQWDEATLRACLEALERQRKWRAPPEVCFEGERLGILDMVQWTHTDDGRGNGRLILTAYTAMTGGGGGGMGGGSWLDGLLKYRIVNIAGIGFASKKATVRKVDQYFDGTIKLLRVPPWERDQVGFSPDAFAESLSPRYIMLQLLLPAFGKAIDSMDRGELMTEGTRLLILLELHRARHGRYPQKLEDLAPEFLRELPIDPYIGKPFGYRLLEGDPDGRGFLLYSYGADKQDNGGYVEAGKDPHYAFRPGNTGKDFVFNMPREKPEQKSKADDGE